MTHTVALGKPDLGEQELAAIAEVFASGWLSGAGPTCLAFEEEFAASTGVKHALATSNCGSALHLGLLALGVGPGDEVIVADYTFPATGHAVVWTGATPRFADVRADTATVDPASVESLVGPRTVGILAVDVAGLPADYDELRAIADRHGLWLMEDAACAAGATYRGRAAGSLADLAAFSFHGRKGITSGEGGALVSNDDALIARARKLHTYGITPAIAREDPRSLAIPQFDEAGYNYRLSDISAAIMRVQLRRLDEFVTRRQAIADRYGQVLAGLDGVALPVVPADRTHPWQAYIITADDGIHRDELITELRSHGVGCNFGTYASHLQPVYGRRDDCPVSADLFARHIALPMHTLMTQADIEHVAASLTTALTKDSIRAQA